ncbi:hypothetical protein [Muricoccus nepalensis]|nr:hypothetical protein [Roseomonas nepalensis]
MVKAGVPWDTAFGLDHAWAFGLTVAMGEAEGDSYDWEALRWRERKKR